jgi:hypothetical protein
MHRSGTSAAARLVNLLGVPTCIDEDLLRTTEDNPRGYWESATLTAFNDRLLDLLEGAWSCPPALPPGWAEEHSLAGLRSEAARAFPTVFPTEEWVWKDPRNCVTLPFWKACLDVQPVVLLVHRNPLEIAESLRARDGFGPLYSLALWERSLRACLESIAGLPALVTDYASIVSEPLAWAETTRAFLAGAGLTTHPLRDEEVLGFVDPGLRHASFTTDDLRDGAELSEPQRALFEALEELRGAHEKVPEVTLPEETPTTEALLGERRLARTDERLVKRQYDELETYTRELGAHWVELEEYARGLQQQYAALEEYARGLQEQRAALEEYARDLQARLDG